MSDNDGFQPAPFENTEDHSDQSAEDRCAPERSVNDSPESNPSGDTPPLQHYSPSQAPQYRQPARPPYSPRPAPPYPQPGMPCPQPAAPYPQYTAPYPPFVPPYPQSAAPYPRSAPPFPQPGMFYPQAGYAAPYYPAYPVRKNGEGFAIASLVLGILSIILCYIPFLDVVLALLALIFGIVAKVKGNGGMAIAGIILGVFGILISALIIYVLVFSVFSETNGFSGNFAGDISNFTAAVRSFF